MEVLKIESEFNKQIVVCQIRLTTKNVDTKFNAHAAFLELPSLPSSCMVKIERLERKII